VLFPLSFAPLPAPFPAGELVVFSVDPSFFFQLVFFPFPVLLFLFKLHPIRLTTLITFYSSKRFPPPPLLSLKPSRLGSQSPPKLSPPTQFGLSDSFFRLPLSVLFHSPYPFGRLLAFARFFGRQFFHGLALFLVCHTFFSCNSLPLPLCPKPIFCARFASPPPEAEDHLSLSTSLSFGVIGGPPLFWALFRTLTHPSIGNLLSCYFWNEPPPVDAGPFLATLFFPNGVRRRSPYLTVLPQGLAQPAISGTFILVFLSLSKLFQMGPFQPPYLVAPGLDHFPLPEPILKALLSPQLSYKGLLCHVHLPNVLTRLFPPPE